MSDKNHRICPVEDSGKLDSRIRGWFQSPRKILAPHIQDGMTALDVGCGPGFFSIEMTRLVGPSGRVIAADLQDGMLEKVANKVRGTALADRITLHQCQDDKIGVSEMVDFVLAFYVVHELPDQEQFFTEMHAITSPGGRVLIGEPPFHVSKKAFGQTTQKAKYAGFDLMERPNVFFSQTMLLQKS